MANAKAKLLVAIDAFHPQHRTLKAGLETVKVFASQARLQTQAIGVLGPIDVAWPTSFTPQWQAHFAGLGRQKLEESLKKLNFNSELAPSVAVQKDYSKRASAGKLAEQAKELSAEILVLFTHIKKSPDYAPLGGFAETVVSASSVPVLLINAKSKPVKKMKTMLFATDFSSEAKAAFFKTVELAKAMNMKIRLFHSLSQPTYALAYAGSTFVPNSAQLGHIFEAEEENAKRTAKAWASEATNLGVEVEIVIDNGMNDPGSEIIKWAHGVGKKSADLIVVAPQVSTLASLILGSTSRTVLRQSKKPVLLIHSERKQKGTKNAEQKISRSHDNKAYSDPL